MKHIVLTSIAVLALAACSDTPEATLDEAYEGGGDDAVELVEGTPEETVPPVETTPAEGEPVMADPSSEIDPSDPATTPVETAAPADDGVSAESELEAPEVTVGDALDTTIESALPESEGAVTTPEELLDAANVPDAEELIEDAGDTLEETAEEVVEEVVEDIEDTETPQ